MELPRLTVTGTRQDMGRQYGTHFRDMIHAFVSDRVAAVDTYLREAGHSQMASLFEAGTACLEQVRTYDPEGYVEHIAIAEGAKLDPVQLFTAANMTDVRDIIVLPGDPPVLEDEGCTAALLPPGITMQGHSIQGQTWDLNGPDVNYVVALHQLPDDGPETWTVTCAGCQTLMGMNEYGVTVGTTNLKTRGARVGIPYLSVLHLALRQTSRDAANALFEKTPVAGSHSYWVGDKSGATEWERTPMSAHARTTDDAPLTRSNHCLIAENRKLESDISESSHARLERMQALLSQSDTHTAQSLSRLFADRSDGRLSINRRAEDQSGATTNAVIACNPAELEFLACRGRADQGDWIKLEFERR
ncbi:C45 family autoproteolytic acyltransferase/hydolase [Eilatimonas milleporae]|uniref:Acyl-CoA:6-aminopenicillanic acid acyl transferase n=1 Tax=Eilatimonas milleporae TaxID=911205 RepID=A0A3M0CGD2_9PROT|nr:C45 family peptidase [Eilatimonas milleporae]RMB08045.1 acyl-CoA:6-aminopenicillanic acid acyl transferase [Eilatimonas milleporae]